MGRGPFNIHRKKWTPKRPTKFRRLSTSTHFPTARHHRVSVTKPLGCFSGQGRQLSSRSRGPEELRANLRPHWDPPRRLSERPASGTALIKLHIDGKQKSGESVEVDSLSHYLQGFIHPRWLALGFLPSTVSLLFPNRNFFPHPFFSKSSCKLKQISGCCRAMIFAFNKVTCQSSSVSKPSGVFSKDLWSLQLPPRLQKNHTGER